ncbi:MAG: hypothetical protein K1X88_21760 [Nannocystaceae bacterium]|nr:hypothetical protein [Nannocystaceae bacterium]
MTAEHTRDEIRFCVALGDGPGGASNRIVVYDWFAHGDASHGVEPTDEPAAAVPPGQQPPPRGGNAVEVLVDGEQAWGRVADDLEQATGEIQIATWMCRPDTELRRPRSLALAEPDARERNTLGATLERRASAGAHVRLLIWGMVFTPIMDRWMRRWFWRGRDGIDVLEQDYPGLTGSYHQKTMTIDGRVGYCGGMNLKENDWDTIAHEAWEPRRFPHRSDGWSREEAVQRRRLPPFLPRHDLMVRIEGPAVGDLMANFAERWRQSCAARAQQWSTRLVDRVRTRLGVEPPSPLPQPPQQPRRGDTWVQIVRTTPDGEHGVLAVYRRAIANARKYIYIENQYFRSPELGGLLAAAIQRNPRLHLVVVAWPIAEGEITFLDPSGYYTAKTVAAIRVARPEFRPSRLQVAADAAQGGRRWVPVDVHAKVMLIDDVWFTVGSANINDRGFRTEAELNAAVVDAGLAADLRRRLMAEHLCTTPDDPRLADIDEAFALWHEHARHNADARAHERDPISHVFAFDQAGPERPPFGAGSGLF